MYKGGDEMLSVLRMLVAVLLVSGMVFAQPAVSAGVAVKAQTVSVPDFKHAVHVEVGKADHFLRFHLELNSGGVDVNLQLQHQIRVKHVDMGHHRMVVEINGEEYNVVTPDVVFPKLQEKLQKELGLTIRTRAKLYLTKEFMYIEGQGYAEVPAYKLKIMRKGHLLGLIPVETEYEVVCPAVGVSGDCELRMPFWAFLIWGGSIGIES